MVGHDELVRRFAARCFSENWPVVLGVAEAIRSQGRVVPQVSDVQVVEEFFKAHVPVAVWESALGYADAVVEEWEVAAGGVSQREKARRSRTALTALLEGDSSALMQQGAHGGLENAQMELMAAKAAVSQTKDHRQRAEAEAKVAKAQARVQEHQDKARARRLAALMVVLGREYSLAEEYEQVVALADGCVDPDDARGDDQQHGEDEADQDVAAFISGEVPTLEKQSEGDGSAAKMQGSILPKFLKK
ncbi:hypothetical protein Cocul_00885 [Corynebacterium oculi]|uniref:Uncharacterized protein n=2 Tax=Corynebacterium oculi TaxID=1544416 RepID=A0A0Q0TYB7_9CORY|nr:hypothetical protein Cocul_00885 [Corynebacterium oculi]